MAASRQKLLQQAWLGGCEGTMSAQTQARAWGLREAWKDERGDKIYGMLTHIASKVYTITKPRAKKEHPSTSALSQLFEKIDARAGEARKPKTSPRTCRATKLQSNRSSGAPGRCGGPQSADSEFVPPAENVTMPLVENCELVATMGGARPAPQTRAIRKKAGAQKVLRVAGPATKL